MVLWVSETKNPLRIRDRKEVKTPAEVFGQAQHSSEHALYQQESAAGSGPSNDAPAGLMLEAGPWRQSLSWLWPFVQHAPTGEEPRVW